jgi:hypothetical protein
MFVVVIDGSRRRLVTETELSAIQMIESGRREKEDEAADRELRSTARAGGLQIAPQ